jgi:hypothetical protein
VVILPVNMIARRNLFGTNTPARLRTPLAERTTGDVLLRPAGALTQPVDKAVKPIGFTQNYPSAKLLTM